MTLSKKEKFLKEIGEKLSLYTALDKDNFYISLNDKSPNTIPLWLNKEEVELGPEGCKVDTLDIRILLNHWLQGLAAKNVDLELINGSDSLRISPSDLLESCLSYIKSHKPRGFDYELYQKISERRYEGIEGRCLNFFQPGYPENFCCETLEFQLFEGLMPIVYSPEVRRYSIVGRYGGGKCQELKLCPWCGTEFPKSLGDEYFDILEELGYDWDEDDIPNEFRSDAWWKARKL